MASDIPRQLTGVFRAPDGSTFANRTVLFFREPRGAYAQGSSVIVDEVVATSLASNGSIDVSLVAGEYLAMVRLTDADRYFRVAVPDIPGPHAIAGLIGNYPHHGIIEAILQAAADAIAAAETAVGIQNGVAAGSTRVYPTRAAAVAATPSLPVTLTHIMAIEGTALVVRERSASADDPLFGTAPRWGVVLRQDVAAETTARINATRDSGVLPLADVAGTDAITAVIDPSLTGITLSALSTVELIPAADNTGAATLNVGGAGAWAVQRGDGTPVEAGDLRAGVARHYRRAGSAWRMVGEAPSEAQARVEAQTGPLAARTTQAEADITHLRARTIQAVMQTGPGTYPPRPDGALSVHWWGWDSPGAAMRPTDVWVMTDEPQPPESPSDIDLFETLTITPGWGVTSFVLDPVPVMVPEVSVVQIRIDAGEWRDMVLTPAPAGQRAELDVSGLGLGGHWVTMRYVNSAGTGTQAIEPRRFWASSADQKILVDAQFPRGLAYPLVQDQGVFDTTSTSMRWYPEDDEIPPGWANGTNNALSQAYYIAVDEARRFRAVLVRADLYVGSAGNSYIAAGLHCKTLRLYASGSWEIAHRWSGGSIPFASGTGAPTDEVTTVELSLSGLDFDAGGETTATLTVRLDGDTLWQGPVGINTAWDRSAPPAGTGTQGGINYLTEPMIGHRTTSGGGGSNGPTRRILNLYAEYA